MTDTVMAATAWPTNAHLIEDCARLGYLRKEWDVLDPTYGKGTFWKRWCPLGLVGHDLKTDGVDFRDLPYPDRTFEAVTFDPPYKLNGTPSDPDERYGVDVPASIKGRHQLMLDGLDECARVLAGRGRLLVKCQDQVASGRVHWQTHMMTARAEAHGLRLVDAMLMLTTPRPQRSQVHARRNYSTMLVFK
jgi:hypothetical protein